MLKVGAINTFENTFIHISFLRCCMGAKVKGMRREYYVHVSEDSYPKVADMHTQFVKGQSGS